jgi:hypothetical protein
LYATATQEPYLCTRFLPWLSSLRSYSVSLIVIQGGGMRGKDEVAQIEALSSPRNGETPLATFARALAFHRPRLLISKPCWAALI